MQITKQVGSKIDSVFLKQQHGRTATRSIQTFRTAFVQEHTSLNGTRVEILRCAIALNNITDHKGHDFDHRNQTSPRAADHVRVDNGYDSLVL